MALTPYDKANIRAIWEKDLPEPPSVKTYFPNYDLSPGSAQVQAQGQKVILALTDAVDNIDDLPASLRALSELHGYRQRVDPVNFKYLAHVMLVTLSSRYPQDFTPAVHFSMDKFLDSVSTELTSRYR